MLMFVLDFSFFSLIFLSSQALKIDKSNNKCRIVQANGGGDPIEIGGHLNKCEVCGKIFLRKNRLKEHRAHHSSEVPFECWLCHKM